MHPSKTGLPALGVTRGGITYPPPAPTYEELYAEVLTKVQHTAIGDRSSDEQHGHAQDIMDALAEAYRIGHNVGMQDAAGREHHFRHEPRNWPNPYEKQADK